MRGSILVYDFVRLPDALGFEERSGPAHTLLCYVCTGLLK